MQWKWSGNSTNSFVNRSILLNYQDEMIHEYHPLTEKPRFKWHPMPKFLSQTLHLRL